MEKKVVLSKRFQKNTVALYNYLIKEFSAKAGSDFLDNLQRRVELIIQHPEVGKPSRKKTNIRSLTLQPHNRIYNRISENAIELLCSFDMRRKDKPY